ncbi:MAG: hypothetical protein SWH78_12805 [Thermodesulfobacteriota bacterium]|nr:hypothetical protein [Thermodesulfobacteriota bacterium]
MSTKLEQLLESIDPSRTVDEVSARVDQAINSFSVQRAIIEDWNEYESFLSDFYRHLLTTVLRIGSGVPENRELYWSQCADLLNKAFGTSGHKAAFEMVRTGKEGGLYQVLKTIGDLVAEKYAKNEISARISDYWQSLTVDGQLAASDEYLQRYGHLLPQELTEGSAARIRANFPKVLEEHPSMVRRMRQIGR